MSNFEKLTGRYLQIHLRAGDRLPFFMSDLDCKKEEELYEEIRRKFGERSADNYIRRIKSKEPSSKKSKKSKSTDVNTVQTEKAVVATEPETTEAQTVTPTKTPLEILLEKEAQLSSEVCAEEAEHSRKISKRAALKNQLVEQRKQMQEIAKKCAELQKEFEETVSQWTALGEEMTVLSTSISEKRANLEAIRSEIDSLKKISMFVYTNGEIEFENQGDFDYSVLDEARISEIFSTLVQQEASENLTIKSIKQLARVLAIVEKLKANQLNFEISFDEEPMKEVYDIVSNN